MTTNTGMNWQAVLWLAMSAITAMESGTERIEQRVTAIGQSLDCMDVGVLSGDIDLEGVIELRDLTTGDLTGETIPVATVYHAIFSDYLNKAFERDNAPEPDPTDPLQPL